MKTLIVPDIHENLTDLKPILSGMDYDNVVFLGDWFDKYHGDNSIETAKFIVERMKSNPKDIFLLGNHDLHYFSDLIIYRCSGFTKQRYINANSIVRPFIDKFKLVHIQGKAVFTHAGIAPPYQQNLFFINQNQKNILSKAFAGKEINPYLEAGISVGGSADIPGLVWTRPIDMDFTKSGKQKLNQVFGHTYNKNYRVWQDGDRTCVCLDTGLTYWGLLQNDAELEIWNEDGIQNQIELR